MQVRKSVRREAMRTLYLSEEQRGYRNVLLKFFVRRGIVPSVLSQFGFWTLILMGMIVLDVHGVACAESPSVYSSGADAPTVTVCSDGGAGAYEAFPDVARITTPDGKSRLMCVFYAGYTHVSLPNAESLPKGGRVVGCWSDDEGRTWSEPKTLIDTDQDDRDPSIFQLPDGRILCNFFMYYGEAGPYNTCLSESTDGGQTWSEPRVIYEKFPCSAPIHRLTSGRLVMGLYGKDPTSGLSCGAIGYSDDDGGTWSDMVMIPNGGVPLDAETDVIELRDGSLYALQREWMGVSRSTDGGETWSESQNVGFAGHCPHFLRTRDDYILLGTRLPKTMLRVSRDECQTWSDAILVDNHIGAYPSMVELQDGSILFVFYQEGGNSDIVGKRFRVTESGLEWLGFDVP